MYIERDTEFNLLYINFSDKVDEDSVAQTKEVMPGVYFDLDADGKLLGIEILSTQEVIGIPVTNLNFSGELIGAEEAAKLFDTDQASFLKSFASRPDFPEPVARLASGQLWLSEDVERYMRKREVASKAFNKTAWIETRPPEG